MRERATTAASTLPKRASKLLAALILLLSGTQLGAHWWPPSSFLGGLRVDYLSPTLYFLDILLVLYLIIQPGKLGASNLKIFLPVLLTNLLFSASPLATLSWSLHLLLYLAFVFSVSPTIIHRSSRILLIAMLTQIVLALMQVARGASLQGFWYYLGERFVTVGSPNVAVGSFLGETTLRAYGTFSHPNILAGWLVVSALIVYRLTQSRRTIFLVTLLATFGILLTQSRAAALSLFGLFIPFKVLSSPRSRALYFAALLCTMYYVLPTTLLTRDLTLSVTDRVSLLGASWHILMSHPFFGAGALSSLALYPSLIPAPSRLQPDHNSLTLLLSWFGLFGVLAALNLLKSRVINPKSFLPLLPLLLLDHYLLTSPQGIFILLLYLRVNSTVYASPNRQ